MLLVSLGHRLDVGRRGVIFPERLDGIDTDFRNVLAIFELEVKVALRLVDLAICVEGDNVAPGNPVSGVVATQRAANLHSKVAPSLLPSVRGDLPGSPVISVPEFVFRRRRKSQAKLGISFQEAGQRAPKPFLLLRC